MAARQVTAAFKQHEVVLSLDSITLQKEIKPDFRKGNIYKQIAASLDHVGLIEPVVVFPRGPDDYLLLDGHVRIDILKSHGATDIRAIFATDDEAHITSE